MILTPYSQREVAETQPTRAWSKVGPSRPMRPLQEYRASSKTIDSMLVLVESSKQSESSPVVVSQSWIISILLSAANR